MAFAASFLLFVMGGNPAESVEAKERELMAVDDDRDEVCLNEHILVDGDTMIEVGNARDVLTRIELDLAYCSEKVLNLDILLMHVASRLSDYEVLDVENSSISSDAAKKAFEFDTLSGILYSEIKELDNYMTSLQTEIVGAHQKIQPSELFKVPEIEKMLQDAEGSLKQSQQQVAEIRIQSTKFERTLALRRKEIWNGEAEDVLQSDHFSSTNDEWKMQTVEQQRHILQMLEKSLARELDLEKKLSDSKNNVGIKSKLHLLECENCCMEEPAETIQENLFGSENVAEFLMEISKELISKPQSVQFNSNGSIQWENEIGCKLQESTLMLSAEELEFFLVQQANSFRDHLRDSEDRYVTANSETLMLKEKVNSLAEKLRESDIQLQQAKDAIEGSEDRQNILHSELTEMAHVLGDLHKNIVKAVSRAESAEAKCTLCFKTNLELKEECCFIRSSLAEKENLLESKLKESGVQLEDANAFAKAIEEEQNLLRAALSDREILIEDLKAKVLKAEIRAESAESKCMLLTDAHLELNEELSFLRSKVECFERSLHQADERKTPNAKDIGINTKIVTYLVMKLVLERECLQAQMLGLRRNKTFRKCWQRTDNMYATSSHVDDKDEEELSFIGSFNESVMWTSTTNSQEENSDAATSVDSETGSAAEVGTMRSVDTRQPNSKSVLISSLVMVLSICGMYVFQLK